MARPQGDVLSDFPGKVGRHPGVYRALVEVADRVPGQTQTIRFAPLRDEVEVRMKDSLVRERAVVLNDVVVRDLRRQYELSYDGKEL